MGKLVILDRVRRPIPAQGRGRGPAKILLFTGVRYERGAAFEAENARPKGGKGKASGLPERLRG